MLLDAFNCSLGHWNSPPSPVDCSALAKDSGSAQCSCGVDVAYYQSWCFSVQCHVNGKVAFYPPKKAFSCSLGGKDDKNVYVQVISCCLDECVRDISTGVSPASSSCSFPLPWMWGCWYRRASWEKLGWDNFPASSSEKEIMPTSHQSSCPPSTLLPCPSSQAWHKRITPPFPSAALSGSSPNYPYATTTDNETWIGQLSWSWESSGKYDI